MMLFSKVDNGEDNNSLESRFNYIMCSLSDPGLDVFERRAMAQDLERFLLVPYSGDDHSDPVDSPFCDMMIDHGWVLIITDNSGDWGKGVFPPSKGIMHLGDSGDPESYNDYPAVILDDGTCMWISNNMLHRENRKPAVITHEGEIELWVYGVKSE